LVLCPFWNRYRFYISWVTITFFLFHLGRSLWQRGQVCNLQCNDASSSYIVNDGQSASSLGAGLIFCFTITFFLLRVGCPHPYPPWRGWSSPKSKSKVKSQSHLSVGRIFFNVTTGGGVGGGCMW
jgi:hypothetical protein